MRTIADLWAGRLSLPQAFWTYAVFWGLLINGAATVASLTIVAAGGPTALALVFHLLPLPWNVLIVVGVWRSAGQPAVSPQAAALARAAVSVLAVALTVL